MRILLTADPEIEVPPRLYGGIERIVDGLVRRLRTRGPSGLPGRQARLEMSGRCLLPLARRELAVAIRHARQHLGAVEGGARLPAGHRSTASRGSPT